MTQGALQLDDRVVVTVDNRIRIERAPTAVIDRIKSYATHSNPTRAKLEAMGVSGYALHKEPREIATWALHGDVLSVPRGLMGEVRDACERAGVARRVIDARCDGDPQLAGLLPAHRFALYDFQEELVNVALDLQNLSVRAPTGSGKTCAALAFASRANVPTIVVVYNAGLLKQWLRAAEAQLGLVGDAIGVVGGGVFRVRALTIAMLQSIRRPATLQRIRTTFGAFVADELQTAAATSFAETYDAFPARYRLGVSANERRRDGKEFLIYDLFGRPALDISQDELIERGIVHDVEIRVVPTDFSPAWYGELKLAIANAELEAEERGEPMPRQLLAQQLGAFDRLLGDMMIDAQRQQIIAEIVRDEVLAGEQVLVMSHRREHVARCDADISALGVRCGRLLGGAEDRADFDAAIAGLRSGALRACAGTYQAVGTGIDLPSIAVGICTTPIANSRDGKSFFQQVRGRLCRRADGKTGARLWYLHDALYGKEPVRNLARWNRKVSVLTEADGWIDAREWLKQ